jgi:Flp pilus assembly protein TadG
MTLHSRHSHRARRRRHGHAGSDRGSATVELVLVAPALLALLGLTVLAGRVVLAGGTVEQVAAAGARAASLARSPAEARTAAESAVRRATGEQHLQCQAITVTVDTTGFATPLGQPASVAVEVSCQVRLADLTIPGAPGSRTVSARAVSPLDPFRGRVLSLGGQTALGGWGGRR